MLIASWLHFTPPPLIVRTLCVWRETDWGEGITTTTVSLNLFVCRVTACTSVFTNSPRRVLPSTTAPQTVQMVIMWTAPLTDHIASRVTAKKISPDTDITVPNICKYRPISNNPIPVSFKTYYSE